MLASFPVFALTFVAAGPVTELLYGATYQSSSTVLMILAGAYYFEVALGCNIESVSLRKSEIDASVVMVDRVAQILGKTT